MECQMAFDRFLQFCSVERLLSQHTISAYSFDLLDFRRWLPGGKSLEDITEEDLRLYLEDMVSTRSLSGATVRRRLACLRCFFRHQTEWEKIKDPFTNWRPKLPRRKRLPRALARSELVSILGSGLKARRYEQDFQNALCLMIATGLRVGELCRIKLEDISPDCAVIRVHGKGSRDRVVYVTDDFVEDSIGCHGRATTSRQLCAFALKPIARTDEATVGTIQIKEYCVSVGHTATDYAAYASPHRRYVVD